MSEIKCDVYVEWSPLKDVKPEETHFIAYYEHDGGIHVNGVYLPGDESDHDYWYEGFDSEQKDCVLQWCIDDYAGLCDAAAAAKEDYVDWAYEQAKDRRMGL